MDEFINTYITSSAWADAFSPLPIPTPANPDDPLEPYGQGQNKITSIMPADNSIGNSSADNLKLHGCSGVKSTFADGNMKYEDDILYCNERSSYYNLGDQASQPNLINNEAYGRSCSLPDVIASTPTSGSFVSNKLQGFEFQEVNRSDDVFSKASIGSDTHLSNFNAMSLNQNSPNGFGSFHAGQQINLLYGALQSEKEENGLCVFSFPSRPPMSMNMAGTVFNPLQTNSSGARAQAAPTNANGCNGVNKPRARARRGQATDPHSIAERLRREKIAERMKNLQELVPSSNKTDKASMLDEIMDYVKFLQLQVKVLSMSRLGAAGAVLPLLENNQTAGSSGILVSSPAGGGADIFESGDCLAFEQEVVKLMETNLTSAIRYLQNKGICLMPIALATAISNHKGSNAAIPDVSTGVSSFDSHNQIERSLDSGANSCSGDVAKQGVPKAA